ncbi:hypothetical protein RH08_05430 [Candidatus Liberibacter asiaticus]|uniref:hypothetical protein n=1 Tax=Liberibacter asiaticus TaxID=34021 RepID=UPI00058BB496|nr:hypothetical protein [Candidatus Liberibacter asiaticus]KIH95337.1 hypothetical protein RH08_05430 [Candidatus Liberibacter asiaticus]
MSTKQQLETTNVLTFKKKLEIGLQQTKSLLRNYVTDEVCERSEAMAIREVFGARDAVFIEGDLGGYEFWQQRSYKEVDELSKRWLGGTH